MRQLKALLLAALALVFVAGAGTGAWIGALAAATQGQQSPDRRLRDFQRVFPDLSPTQVRQLREIFHDLDEQKKRVREITPEQRQQLWALEAASRDRVRQVLTGEQRTEYDRRVQPR